MNGETHNPITLLDGRDGESLRKWLQNTKHVKVVTRDRVSAYAKVIAEELPDAMQVADRFHLHQNLLDAIKKALNHELPATIKIPHTEGFRECKTFEPQPYIRTRTGELKYKAGSTGKQEDYITREGVFKHMWMNMDLTEFQRSYIYDKFPDLWEIYSYIKEFRNIFQKRKVILFHLFIDKYKSSKIKALRSFAKGPENDMDAVENVDAYDFSNGFVEVTNSRLKMIKRTMYGRCSNELLEAKLCYMRQDKNR